MKKSEFLRILKDSLMGMSQNDKREIMLDYEEHFIDGLAEGRTEEEICEALGDPKQIALNLKRNMEFNNPTPTNDGVNTAAYIIGIIALSVGVIWLVSVLIGLVLGSISTIYAVIAFSTIFTVPSLFNGCYRSMCIGNNDHGAYCTGHSEADTSHHALVQDYD